MGLVALAPAGKGVNWVFLDASSTVPVRAAVVIENKVSNLAETTGKCSNIIIYMVTVNVSLISPQFRFFSQFLGVAAFSAVGNSSFCNGHGFWFRETPQGIGSMP